MWTILFLEDDNKFFKISIDLPAKVSSRKYLLIANNFHFHFVFAIVKGGGQI